ncbi:MAG: hypothetical protein BroJett030_27070 [Alphaproteobacteria bacterium]|nr:MAG: hypothetical protein BroJett030_27070 [Alphaproteobacteria bacterium]
MKRSTKLVLATLAVVVTAGGAIAAQGYRTFADGRQMGQRLFNEADADKDGAVSLDEMLAVLTARFDEADANGDGSLDKAEIIGAVERNFERARRHSGRIADGLVYRLDLDDSGAIARSELENRARKMFALADFNDDGKVELAEIGRMHGGWDRRHHGGRDGHHGRWWRGDRGPAMMDEPKPDEDR